MTLPFSTILPDTRLPSLRTATSAARVEDRRARRPRTRTAFITAPLFLCTISLYSTPESGMELHILAKYHSRTPLPVAGLDAARGSTITGNRAISGKNLPRQDPSPHGSPAKNEEEERRQHGGGGGIRTHEALASPPVFKTGAFNRSATPPGEMPQASDVGFTGKRRGETTGRGDAVIDGSSRRERTPEPAAGQGRRAFRALPARSSIRR